MTPAELQPFCSTDENRPSLALPFFCNGWIYATDGRVIVRVPCDDDRFGGGELSSRTDTPDAAALFRWTKGPAAVGLPSGLPSPSEVPCPDCEGCGGKECDMGHTHECPKCGGDGVVTVDPAVEIGGMFFGCRRLRLIAALPGVQLWPTPGQSVCVFTFEGGDGLLFGRTTNPNIKP